MSDYLKLGTWNVVCQVCGFKYKSDELKKRWDGLYVCDKDFEHRHPMDFYKARGETKSIPWSSPEPSETHITVNYVSSSVGTQDSTIPEGHNDGSL